MQLRIYRRLNLIALLSGVVLVALAIILILNHTNLGNNFSLWLIIYIILGIAFVVGFKLLENNWDKVKLQKDTFAGKVVLANIKSSKFICVIRDTSFKKYLLMAIAVTYYDHKMKPHDTTIIEKLNYGCHDIPKGSVWMTYDTAHPDRGLIVQNVIISHVPALEPLVKKYEADPNINIKYLDTHYDDGLVIRTFEETVKVEKEKAKVKKELDAQAKADEKTTTKKK